MNITKDIKHDLIIEIEKRVTVKNKKAYIFFSFQRRKCKTLEMRGTLQDHKVLIFNHLTNIIPSSQYQPTLRFTLFLHSKVVNAYKSMLQTSFFVWGKTIPFFKTATVTIYTCFII